MTTSTRAPVATTSSPEAAHGFKPKLKLVDTIPAAVVRHWKNRDNMVVLYLDATLKLQADEVVAVGPMRRTAPPQEFINAVTSHPYAWGGCWLNDSSDNPLDPPKNVMYTWIRDDASVDRVHKLCHTAYALDVREMLRPSTVKQLILPSEHFSA
jgi:hypothetical protein